MKRGRSGRFHSGVDRLVGFHIHVMKLTIKGKSDKQAFTVAVSMESLIGFLTAAATKAEEQFDDELATSPGGWPTAIFTAMLPQKAREAVGWDLTPQTRFKGQDRLLELEEILAQEPQHEDRAEIQSEILKLRQVPVVEKEVIGVSPIYGWDDEKAMAAFESRLERKQGGGAFSIEARQKAWDEKVANHAAELEAEGLKPERALELAKKHAGKRPEAKEGKAPSGKAEVLAALA